MPFRHLLTIICQQSFRASPQDGGFGTGRTRSARLAVAARMLPPARLVAIARTLPRLVRTVARLARSTESPRSTKCSSALVAVVRLNTPNMKIIVTLETEPPGLRDLAPADEDRTTGSGGGGAGGGSVILHTPGTVRVTDTGSITAAGGIATGENEHDSGVGGGGAGGSVLITAASIEVTAAGSVDATGGAAVSASSWCGGTATGGAGGDGRIRLSTDSSPSEVAGSVTPRPFTESMEEAENDGCALLVIILQLEASWCTHCGIFNTVWVM